MVVIKNNEVFSDEGKYIHRKGTDTYFKRSMALPTDTEENFEEVDEIPAYTKAQYDEMVGKLIRERYTASEEFAIQRKMINATNTPTEATDAPENVTKAIEEYETYNTFVEECKVRAKNPDLYNTQEA